jgi:hypothetical protein
MGTVHVQIAEGKKITPKLLARVEKARRLVTMLVEQEGMRPDLACAIAERVSCRKRLRRVMIDCESGAEDSDAVDASDEAMRDLTTAFILGLLGSDVIETAKGKNINYTTTTFGLKVIGYASAAGFKFPPSRPRKLPDPPLRTNFGSLTLTDTDDE